VDKISGKRPASSSVVEIPAPG
jgi:hypothetical protein